MVKNFSSFKEDIIAFSQLHGEPQWFLDQRLEALEQIETLALPRFQRAKYKDFELFEQPLCNDEILTTGSVPDFVQTKNNAVFYQEDDTTTFIQLPQELVQQGVILCDLHEALSEHEELMKTFFMTKAVLPNEDRLTAFHTAFVNNGTFLYIPKHVVVKDVIETIFMQKETSKAFVKHLLILADENSEVTYLEHFMSDGKDKKAVSANIIVEVIAKQGAQVNYSAVDELGENVTAYINRRGYVLKDAMLDWALGIMSDGNVLADFDTDLVGEGAHSELKAVAISSGSQKQIVDSRVTNKAPHTIGHILQHGVIADASSLIFNGIGHIIKGAVGSDAQQESRVLMLSDEARGDANPILLIDDNDVVAGHAASVGQVDPEDLYYLMSRGLRLEDAQRLVIRGFLGSVITAIPVKSAQKEFITVIEGKLNAEI